MAKNTTYNVPGGRGQIDTAPMQFVSSVVAKHVLENFDNF